MNERYRLIVEEDFVNELSVSVRNYCESIETSIDEYIRILQGIVSNAISSGETSNAIADFIMCAEGLNGTFESIGNCFDITMNCFLGDIDDADKYLY